MQTDLRMKASHFSSYPKAHGLSKNASSASEEEDRVESIERGGRGCDEPLCSGGRV